MLNGVQITKKHNPRWLRFFEKRLLSVILEPIISKEETVFTIGSCFAREIRTELQSYGVQVTPRYEDLVIDRDRQELDGVPGKPHLSYYNTFTIRQEFERAAGRWKQSADDHWVIPKAYFGADRIYQDPYKRLTFGKTPEDLFDVVEKANAAFDKGFREASVFFLTFGMVEVFRKKNDGRIACQKPTYGGGGGLDETEFHLSSFAENLANIEAIRKEIKQVNPDAKLVVTVSPVPLERTFSGADILVANTEGKAMLRACLGEFARAHDDVVYFPAYEIVSTIGENAFQSRDLRHVDRQAVRMIMKAFTRAHMA